MADAGKYVLRDLFWDERVNPVTEAVPIFKRHQQGEVLDLDEAEATRLVDAGSVELEGEREVREADAAVQRARAALANVPDHLRHLVSDVDPADLAVREVPIEERTVHFGAEGLVNEGHPKYAAAAHGEGDGGADDDTTVADLDRTQAALDDGTGNSTPPPREHKAQPGDVAAKATKPAAAKKD